MDDQDEARGDSAENPSSPAPSARAPLQGEHTQGEETQVEDTTALAITHDDPELDQGDHRDDVEPDPVEATDPAAYWKAVRTRQTIDMEVGTGVLRPREGAFVIEYTMTPDDKRGAAIRAGYAPTGAHVQATRLLKRDAVQRAIAREFAKKAAQTGIDRSYLIAQLDDIARDDRQKAADRLRALELMGKLVGAFAPEEHVHRHQGLRWDEIEAEDAEVVELKDVRALSS